MFRQPHAADPPAPPVSLPSVYSLLGCHASPDKVPSLEGDTNLPNDICETFYLNYKIFSRPKVIVINI